MFIGNTYETNWYSKTYSMGTYMRKTGIVCSMGTHMRKTGIVCSIGIYMRKTGIVKHVQWEHI